MSSEERQRDSSYAEESVVGLPAKEYQQATQAKTKEGMDSLRGSSQEVVLLTSGFWPCETDFGLLVSRM